MSNFIWFEMRLLFTCNLIITFVNITSIIILYNDYLFDYTNLSFAITYSMNIGNSLLWALIVFMHIEKSFISVERLR